MCVAQADYYRILTQGERSIQCIEEDGDVVMVTEFRKTDGGSRQGQVVIKVSFVEEWLFRSTTKEMQADSDKSQ